MRVPESAAGKRGSCPKCGQVVDIPAGIAGTVTSPASSSQPTTASASAVFAEPATGNTIDFQCQTCHQPVTTPRSTAGQQGRCPHCQTIMQIPGNTPFGDPGLTPVGGVQAATPAGTPVGGAPVAPFASANPLNTIPATPMGGTAFPASDPLQGIDPTALLGANPYQAPTDYGTINQRRRSAGRNIDFVEVWLTTFSVYFRNLGTVIAAAACVTLVYAGVMLLSIGAVLLFGVLAVNARQAVGPATAGVLLIAFLIASGVAALALYSFLQSGMANLALTISEGQCGTLGELVSAGGATLHSALYYLFRAVFLFTASLGIGLAIGQSMALLRSSNLGQFEGILFVGQFTQLGSLFVFELFFGLSLYFIVDRADNIASAIHKSATHMWGINLVITTVLRLLVLVTALAMPIITLLFSSSLIAGLSNPNRTADTLIASSLLSLFLMFVFFVGWMLYMVLNSVIYLKATGQRVAGERRK